MKNFGSLAKFLEAFITNRSKDLFVARLGTKLLLMKYGITGLAADLASWFIRSLLGVFMDEGIYQIDVTLDSIKAALSIDEFKKVASTEYVRAHRKGITDAEKVKLRQEYLDTLDRFTRLRVQHNANTQSGIHSGDSV